jgi:hypothetical protein
MACAAARDTSGGRSGCLAGFTVRISARLATHSQAGTPGWQNDVVENQGDDDVPHDDHPFWLIAGHTSTRPFQADFIAWENGFNPASDTLAAWPSPCAPFGLDCIDVDTVVIALIRFPAIKLNAAHATHDRTENL